jgi:transposase
VAEIPKQCQKFDSESRHEKSQLKAIAAEHFRSGGNAREFSERHGLPRTTVIGWRTRWETERQITEQGRPRKLQPFNESEVLKTLLNEPQFCNWTTVRERIRSQSGEVLSRRAVMRLLRRWAISKEPGSFKGCRLLATSWLQPDITRHGGAPSLQATLWRLLSGRGLEFFMFTHSGTEDDIDRVRKALGKRWKTSRAPGGAPSVQPLISGELKGSKMRNIWL